MNFLTWLTQPGSAGPLTVAGLFVTVVIFALTRFFDRRLVRRQRQGDAIEAFVADVRTIEYEPQQRYRPAGWRSASIRIARARVSSSFVQERLLMRTWLSEMFARRLNSFVSETVSASDPRYKLETIARLLVEWEAGEATVVDLYTELLNDPNAIQTDFSEEAMSKRAEAARVAAAELLRLGPPWGHRSRLENRLAASRSAIDSEQDLSQ